MAKRIAPLLKAGRGRLLRSSPTATRGFVYLARAAARRAAPGRWRSWRSRGSTSSRRRSAIYPAKWLASQAARHGRHRRAGPVAAWSTRRTARCAGTRGERRIVQDALGEPITLRDERATRAGANLTLTLDAAIQDKAEEVLAEVGRDVSPQGGHRGRDGSATGDAARRGQLAAHRRQRGRRGARLRARRTAPSSSPTSPARRSSRSPWRARSRSASSRPTTSFSLAADDPGRRPHDRARRTRAAR